MKKILIILLIIPVLGFSQVIENVDFISPFHDEMAAIKKNNQWAFINIHGDIVVNFRNDLVTSKFLDGDYPIFKNGRCLIVNEKDGVLYFGYINTYGKTVIEPRFLNATNFNNNIATALELDKEEMGRNPALDKKIVNYKYFEVTIDTVGNVKNYLTHKGVHVVLDKDFLREPPKFTSKQISDNLVVTRNEKGKWTLKKINE
ncbi:WG repeat-containing protein [Xanthomarina spongicola]|uniref:WG repeat protein n=1 Tax=Xanthomarina spongicola TaxID=570520 RepID=A0A316DVT9_9FLAO|nr:WG repeat-containing protein [Xanthomarina spongicola]PWK20693.1 WG repeat protein [Xanthomarina spongicola]